MRRARDPYSELALFLAVLIVVAVAVVAVGLVVRLEDFDERYPRPTYPHPNTTTPATQIDAQETSELTQMGEGRGSEISTKNSTAREPALFARTYFRPTWGKPLLRP